MSSADSDPKRADGKANDAPPEESFWAAAGGFSEKVAEEHASKIVALWELGGDFEALKPARGESGEDDGVWSAERPSAVELEGEQAAEKREAAADDDRKKAPAEDEQNDEERAPASEKTSSEEPAEPRAAQAAPEPAPAAIDEPVTLPTSNRTKLFAVVGVAACLLLAAVAFMAALGGGDAAELPRATLTAPSVAAAPQAGPAPATRAGEQAEPTDDSPSGDDATAELAPAATVAKAEPAEAESAAAEPEPAAAVDKAEAAPAEPEPSSSPAELAASEPERAEAPVETATSPALATSLAPAEPERAPQPPPTATLRVRTEPPHASLTVDGRPASNPYTATVPVGSRVRLAAQAEGHRNASRTIRVGSGTEEVTLTLAARPTPRARPARTQPARRQPARTKAPERRTRGAGFTTQNPY